MPIYHFNVCNEAQGAWIDPVGTELPDAETAERECMHLVGAMVADSALAGRRIVSWHAEVTDHTGTPLFNLDFTIRPGAGPLGIAPLAHAV